MIAGLFCCSQRSVFIDRARVRAHDRGKSQKVFRFFRFLEFLKKRRRKKKKGT